MLETSGAARNVNSDPLVTGWPWLFVVGMHRSGTSAVTGAIGALGLAMPSGDDLISGLADNPNHYESQALSEFNEQLLGVLGGSWSAPPVLPDGWENSPSVTALDEDAFAAAETAFPNPGPRVWKDPRTCLLLPYWRRILPGRIPVVLIWRSPQAVARSLHDRDGFSVTHGLALWDWYSRGALENLTGHPVLALAYDEFVTRPLELLEEIGSWLTDLGILEVMPSGSALETAAAVVSPLLNHGSEEMMMPPEQMDLAVAFASIRGVHEVFAPPELPDLPESVHDHLLERRELEAAREDAHQVRRAVNDLKGLVSRLRWRETGPGFWVTTPKGVVERVGAAPFHGDLRYTTIGSPVVGVAAAPSGGGYWLVTESGSFLGFGTAANVMAREIPDLEVPIVGIAAVQAGPVGCWAAAADGTVIGCGDAPLLGSMKGHPLNAPIVGIAGTPKGLGYRLVAADGGIFCFGGAPIMGSLGDVTLDAPVVGMAVQPDGGGYWIATEDGSVFSYGNAEAFGTVKGQNLESPIVAIVASPDGEGYWLVSADGVFTPFGPEVIAPDPLPDPLLRRRVRGVALVPEAPPAPMDAEDLEALSFQERLRPDAETVGPFDESESA